MNTSTKVQNTKVQKYITKSAFKATAIECPPFLTAFARCENVHDPHTPTPLATPVSPQRQNSKHKARTQSTNENHKHKAQTQNTKRGTTVLVCVLQMAVFKSSEKSSFGEAVFQKLLLYEKAISGTGERERRL